MLKDIPYDTLKSEPRKYEILLLRDLYDNTYTDIAKEFELSLTRVNQIYHGIKIKQIRLYMNHLALISGHADIQQFRKLCDDVYDCY